MKLRLCNNDMELALTGNENGWWIVSHESKLWLPNGELPSGTAAALGLQGHMARTIGEWEERAGLAGAPGDAAGDGIVRQLLGSGSRSVPACRARRSVGGFLPLSSLLRLLRP